MIAYHLIYSLGFEGVPAYVASKHGLIGLTRTAALEYATQGIRINSVSPGVIDTPMMERFTGGDPEALAGIETMLAEMDVRTIDDFCRRIEVES